MEYVPSAGRPAKRAEPMFGFDLLIYLREFESRPHKRLIDILKPSNKTVEALMSLQLPAGVDIEIKL